MRSKATWLVVALSLCAVSLSASSSSSNYLPAFYASPNPNNSETTFFQSPLWPNSGTITGYTITTWYTQNAPLFPLQCATPPSIQVSNGIRSVTIPLANNFTFITGTMSLFIPSGSNAQLGFVGGAGCTPSSFVPFQIELLYATATGQVSPFFMSSYYEDPDLNRFPGGFEETAAWNGNSDGSQTLPMPTLLSQTYSTTSLGKTKQCSTLPVQAARVNPYGNYFQGSIPNGAQFANLVINTQDPSDTIDTTQDILYPAYCDLADWMFNLVLSYQLPSAGAPGPFYGSGYFDATNYENATSPITFAVFPPSDSPLSLAEFSYQSAIWGPTCSGNLPSIGIVAAGQTLVVIAEYGSANWLLNLADIIPAGTPWAMQFLGGSDCSSPPPTYFSHLNVTANFAK